LQRPLKLTQKNKTRKIGWEGRGVGPPVYLRKFLGEGLVIIQERVAGLTEAALAKFVTRARRMAGLRGAVSVLVTSSRELQGLNRLFRGKNKPTDVLSFPAMPGLMRGFAGDVAISAEIAAQNARRLGHTAAEEIRILTLHAVLHLAGYDHELDDGEMERKEIRLRKTLGLPVGLIERRGRLNGAKSPKAKGTSNGTLGKSRAPGAKSAQSAPRAPRASR
jgi:probable rRNA maturation factor